MPRFYRYLVMILFAISISQPLLANAQSVLQCNGTGSSNTPISLDGQFSDWQGRSCISDPEQDCKNDTLDLQAIFFGSNPNEQTLYFMVSRYEDRNSPMNILLAIDTNNNGNYNDPTDRVLSVRYKPKQNDSDVDIDLMSPAGFVLTTIASNANYGDSVNSGARRVEFGVTFAQLGISVGQAIRFTVHTNNNNQFNNTFCDSSAEVQWTPADALGLPLLIGLLGLAAWVLAERRKVC